MKDYIEEYVDIHGIKHYFLHYPYESDMVIMYLHGGPGQAESQFGYLIKDERLKCSVVYYDQRGAGKTQLMNKTKPEEVTLDVLLGDLKEAIRYVKQRYQTEKVLLIGHSWGSILATCYVKENPQDVIGYVGTGQVVDMMKNEEVGYRKLAELIEERGNPKHIKELSKFKGYPYEVPKEELIKTILRFRKLQGKYGITGDTMKTVKAFSKSPVFHLTDLYPMFTSLKTNKHLLDMMFSYSAYNDLEYKLPVFFICGTKDWQTPSVLVQEYYERVQAPKKGLYWVEDAGHLVILDNPKGYNDALLKIIEELRTVI